MSRQNDGSGLGTDDHGTAREGERRYWLDDPKNVDKIVYTLYTVCALLLLADLFYDRHAHFEFENLIGFYGLFGFIGSVTLVMLAKQLRKVVMRPEDYYDPPAEGSTTGDKAEDDAEGDDVH